MGKFDIFQEVKEKKQDVRDSYELFKKRRENELQGFVEELIESKKNKKKKKLGGERSKKGGNDVPDKINKVLLALFDRGFTPVYLRNSTGVNEGFFINSKKYVVRKSAYSFSERLHSMLLEILWKERSRYEVLLFLSKHKKHINDAALDLRERFTFNEIKDKKEIPVNTMHSLIKALNHKDDSKIMALKVNSLKRTLEKMGGCEEILKELKEYEDIREIERENRVHNYPERNTQG